MPSDSKETTTIINRHIRPGHELDYANWFGRMVEATKSPGFRGITVIVPGDGDPDARIILYRFADIVTMENWENSPERKELLSEVDRYATQIYDKASGLETWFYLPGSQSMSKPPPRWKMATVVFLAAGITSFISYSALDPYLSGWPLTLTTP